MKKYASDQEAKQQILDVGKRIYEHGFVASNDGNISCRVGVNEFWVTPTGVSKGFMTEEMLIKIDKDGNVLEGSHKPSSEIKIHLRVYEENDSVKGTVHAHPLVATCFATAGMSLESPILTEGILVLGSVPLAHYEKPGTGRIADSIAPYCKDFNGVLLSNHGALTWGDSLMQAYYRMETVEYYAKAMLITKYILGKSCELSQSQVDDLIKIRENTGIHSGGRPAAPKNITNDMDVVLSEII